MTVHREDRNNHYGYGCPGLVQSESEERDIEESFNAPERWRQYLQSVSQRLQLITCINSIKVRLTKRHRMTEQITRGRAEMAT